MRTVDRISDQITGTQIVTVKEYLRDMEMLIRERKEKELFLSMMLAEKALVYAQERMNRMKYGGQ